MECYTILLKSLLNVIDSNGNVIYLGAQAAHPVSQLVSVVQSDSSRVSTTSNNNLFGMYYTELTHNPID